MLKSIDTSYVVGHWDKALLALPTTTYPRVENEDGSGGISEPSRYLGWDSDPRPILDGARFPTPGMPVRHVCANGYNLPRAN